MRLAPSEGTTLGPDILPQAILYLSVESTAKVLVEGGREGIEAGRIMGLPQMVLPWCWTEG